MSCPTPRATGPIADYVKAFKKAKEIFPGEVATQLVAGIQSDENLLKGVEHFASEGVPTLVTPFLPFGHGPPGAPPARWTCPAPTG
jgi:hypothetical protein